MLKKIIWISFSLALVLTGFIFCLCTTFKEEVIQEDAPSSLLEKLSFKETMTIDATSSNEIGYLAINDIHLKANLYDPENSLNQVNKNVTILVNEEHIKVLAAHSGSGKTAYFKDLHKLFIGSVIEMKFGNEISTYLVDRIYTTEKNGMLAFSRRIDNSKRIILTTCGESKDTQLIIEAIEQKK